MSNFSKSARAICLLTGLALGQHAIAQSNVSDMQIPKDSQKSISATIDGTALLLKGFGVKAGIAASDRMIVGGKLSRYQIKVNHENVNNSSSSVFKDFQLEANHTITTGGVFADLFLTNNQDQSGVFISGAVVSTHVKTEAKDIFSNMSSTDSAAGIQALGGYQFVNRMNSNLNMVFQAALGYGNGGRIGWTYNSQSGASTKVQNGLVLGLTGGAQF